jgi:hypothetical protein
MRQGGVGTCRDFKGSEWLFHAERRHGRDRLSMRSRGRPAWANGRREGGLADGAR